MQGSSLSPRPVYTTFILYLHLWGMVWEQVLSTGVSHSFLPVPMWPGEIVQPGREVTARCATLFLGWASWALQGGEIHP